MTTYNQHKLTTGTASNIETLRMEFTKLHLLIEEFVPTSRERAVALTNLEQAAMWAVKAAVVTDPASVEV